jgi:hypothetical protein
VFVLCVRFSVFGYRYRSPVQGVLPTVLDLVTEVKQKVHGGSQGPNWAVEPKEEKNTKFRFRNLN